MKLIKMKLIKKKELYLKEGFCLLLKLVFATL